MCIVRTSWCYAIRLVDEKPSVGCSQCFPRRTARRPQGLCPNRYRDGGDFSAPIVGVCLSYMFEITYNPSKSAATPRVDPKSIMLIIESIDAHGQQHVMFDEGFDISASTSCHWWSSRGQRPGVFLETILKCVPQDRHIHHRFASRRSSAQSACVGCAELRKPDQRTSRLRACVSSSILRVDLTRLSG